MSDTLFLAEMHHRAEAKNMPFDVVIDDVVDEIAELELTNSSDHLGGVAKITVGPISVSFNSVLLGHDDVRLKGPLGHTVSRINKDTDLAENIIDFVNDCEDISCMSWEER